MTQILSTGEILSLGHRGTKDEGLRFARVVEQAVIAKLREQKPVAVVIRCTTYHDDETTTVSGSIVATGDLPAVGTELFTRPAPRAPKWQPIATAPKDGTRVLIRGDCVVVAGWEEVIGNEGVLGWCIVNDAYMPEHIATHWMPLPKRLTEAPSAPEVIK